MKKTILFLVLIIFVVNVTAQGIWTQKANLTPPNGREDATGFSIGHYGFIGLGSFSNGLVDDFWKWNQKTNTWTQIANYPGAGRWGVTGFTIGGKGYCCFGWDGSFNNTDLWEYDTTSNTWTQKANFPGAARYGAFVFVIGTKAYIGCGEPNGQPYDKDVWVYDALANTWTQVADFPGGERTSLCSFAMNDFGYAGCGEDGAPLSYNTMWQYNPNTNTWKSVASMPIPGSGAGGPVSFVIGCLAYVGTALNNSSNTYYNNFYSYNDGTNTWAAIASVPAAGRWLGVGFAINNKGYVGTGASLNGGLDDYWEYGISNNTNILVSDTNLCLHDSVHFSDSSTYNAMSFKWYFPGGSPATSILQNPSVYYLASGTYTVSLVITNCGNKDTISRVIHVIGGITGAKITGASPLCLGTPDVISATGGTSYLWSTGATTSSITVTPLTTTTYSIIITGNGNCKKDTSITVTVLPYPTISLSGKDTICSGNSINLSASGGSSYLWSTGATTDSISLSPLSNTTYTLKVSNGPCSKDTSVTVIVNPSPNANITGKNQVCKGDSITLTATGGGIYTWSTNQTSDSIKVTPSSTSVYTVVVSNSFGCKANAVFQVNVASPIDSIIGPSILCSGDSITLSAIGGSYYQWSTGATTSSIEIDIIKNATYYVSNICHDTARKSIFEDNNTLPLYACCDTTIAMPGIPVTLNASGRIHYYWTPSIGINCDSCPNPIITPTVTTTYTVVGTDSAGCRVVRTITVDVLDCLSSPIPNVFTPNGDGINDEFVIDAQYVSGYSISIYDRWGKEMYHSDNPNLYWDGKNQNDHELVSDGVYYYIIKYSCNNKSYNKDGYIQVIR